MRNLLMGRLLLLQLRRQHLLLWRLLLLLLWRRLQRLALLGSGLRLQRTG